MAVDSSQAATALLSEHLQYTPLSLIDDIINAVNNFVYQGISSLENGLFSTPPERLGFKPTLASETENGQSEPEYPDAKQEIEEGLHKLETLLESTVDKNFDKFEIYVLRNVLSVPTDLANWVRLSHYDNLTYPLPVNTPTPESVQLLRRKVAASQAVSNALRAEHARNEAMLDQLRSMTSSVAQTHAQARSNLAFLTEASSASAFSISSSNSQQPLTTNTNFALSQLPALKAILVELRPKLVALHSPGITFDTAKDEMKVERRAYIEQRTREHLDRKGAASDENGVPVRNIEKEEVQAMEKVAAMFAPP